MRCFSWLPASCFFCILLAAVGCARGYDAARPAPSTPDAPFTFAVLGDNRGGPDGVQPAVFREIVHAINAASPSLVFNTGDMIYGYTEDEAELRRMWQEYREVIGELDAPLNHVPGNHDLFDEQSARVYRELWGATYYAFDHGNARFIALDTETDAFRVGPTQLAWLGEQLQEAGDRHVFVFLHKPVFPTSAHIGSSLDRYPANRDELHRLLVRYGKSIRGVFQGHEHLYHFEGRDGVPYYITAGGGANLYAPPELGGFHHYLLVHVTRDSVAVEVRKVGMGTPPPRPAAAVQPSSLLEDWEGSALFWYAWDETVTRMLTREHFSEGKQGLKLWFDLARQPSPLLYVPLPPARDLNTTDAIAMDVYLPANHAGRLVVTPSIKAGGRKYPAPAVALQAGWNTMVTELNDAWLPRNARGAVEQIEWILSSDRADHAGWVVFDHFRTLARSAAAEAGVPRPGTTTSSSHGWLREGWESGLLWGAWNTTATRPASVEATMGDQALEVEFDLAKLKRPTLYAVLNPAWDLRGVERLALDVFVPQELAGPISLTLALRSEGNSFTAPAVSLAPGWNKVATDLGGGWLPTEARACAEVLELVLSSSHRQLAGWVVVDNLRALGRRR